MDYIDLNEINLSFPVTDDFAGMCEKKGIDRVLKALDNAPKHSINGTLLTDTIPSMSFTIIEQFCSR